MSATAVRRDWFVDAAPAAPLFALQEDEQLRPSIWATADLHGDLTVSVPPCDVLIVAGDVCPDISVTRQLDWLDKDFRPWLEKQRANVILGIAGNHDFVFEKWPGPAADLELPWFYLQDERFVMDGVSFYGIPWVPNLSSWAFHLDDVGLQKKFDAVPAGTDIVISHGPPHMFGDKIVPRYGGVHAGFPGTHDMLARVKPKAFVCGHIHEGYGFYLDTHTGTAIYNVSRNTENYMPINAPQEIVL